MFRLSNISIGFKLAIGFGLMLLMTAALGVMTIQSVETLSAATVNLYDHPYRVTRALLEAKSEALVIQREVRSAILSPDATGFDRAEAAIAKAEESIAEHVNEAKRQFLGDPAEMAAVEQMFADWKPIYSQVIGLTRADRREQATAYANNQGAAKIAEVNEHMDRVIGFATKKAASFITSAQTTAQQIHATSIALLAGSLLLGVTIAFLTTRGIATPLRVLIDPITEMGAGNFRVRIDGADRKDEVGRIAAAVSTMLERVRRTLAEIKLSAREVNSASGEISTSTTDLSQRTEEQAASLEQTTAAMEEISVAIKKSAENADQANKSAGLARSVADEGGAVAARAVNAMAKIEESSRKISDIIGVIDEIARQTNLLALNAAVEAARAGEAGRGFAVVASEVRSLAQRSSQAAKDIKELITSSNGQVREGVDLVNQAGGALGRIVESVKDAAALVNEIARASAAQAGSLEQINKALTQMDQVTQQNAALVEENAATAKSLEQRAHSMDERVGFFQIDDSAGPAQRPAAPTERSAVEQPSVGALAPPSTPVRNSADFRPTVPVLRVARRA
jgi:methyl-accepting chemotaxis protein